MKKKYTESLRSIEKGSSIKIHLSSLKEALSIRSLCSKINRTSNQSETKLSTKTTRTESGICVEVSNSAEKTNVTQVLKSITTGKSVIIDDNNVDYNAVHATASFLNKKTGSNLKVSKVIKIENNNADN